MLELKEYQDRSLKALSSYFAEVRLLGSASLAFAAVTERTFGQQLPYRQVKELPGLPYVCLRIPTGGGKTLVAAHAAGLAAKELVEVDRPVVLWLVPSNPIREQTLAAIHDRAHPYRRALEQRLGACEVMDVAEALAASRARYAGGATVIIATMQAFRVTETEGRKVYEQNGVLMDHFTSLPGEAMVGLDHQEDGTPVPSLANVLALYRPILIVDEAHNARTDLSFETLARFRPSCVLEFTATPASQGHPSNVLHTVSAAELKVEHMIKLPIRLETRRDWKLLLADAITQLNVLEEAARRERTATGEYIRPMMLIQAEAQRGSDPVTVDVVRQTLIDDHRVPEAQIARATGTFNELDGVEVLAPGCPLRFVITVQQLREGWDCPFAYVLCSVAQTRSSTAVEQLLGRVMRLPRAQKKKESLLNQAYAFSASASFADAANALADALVQNGFEKQEAKDLITRANPRYEHQDLPLFGEWDTPVLEPVVTLAVTELPDVSALPPALAEKLSVNAEERTVTLRGSISAAERDALAAAFTDAAGKSTASVLYQRTLDVTRPVREHGRLSVPLLAIRQGEFWEPFEATHFLEAKWDLATCDARIEDTEWTPGRSDAQIGTVTITDRGRAEYFIAELHQQLSLVTDDRNWNVGALLHWLDRTIAHPDVSPDSAGVFLFNVVRFLTEEREIPFAELVRDKYRLRQAVAAKIEQHRNAAYQNEYQALLFGDSSAVGVTPSVCFTYEPGEYPYRTIYRGPRKWKKHLYPQVGDLDAQGEEFDFACFLDSELPQVERWVRNVARPPSFWLQTSTDRFYPDFVCRLSDGRILVVESKGEHLWSNDDSREKRALGELWEARSGGKCLFVMPRGKDFEAIRAKILS
ncbi:MAG: DEAD/DEAH box helicase family protein [Gemmatimonadota bacterium]